MKTARFFINQREFESELNPVDAQNQFHVRSVPRPYRVTFDRQADPISSVQKILDENPNHLLLIDERVYTLYGSSLSHPKEKIFKAQATEDFKSAEGMLRVVDFMSSNQLTKADKLLVVGGGIIQDVGAFAGAVYRRGVPWVYFPTTLLSQCDSCIGGKTGLNYGGAKNQLALFSAPSEVIINPKYLETLSLQEIQSGMGEVIKLHITGGIDFFAHYAKLAPKLGEWPSQEAFQNLILGSLAVKKVVVEEDEFELDLRRSMNYGHTFGHAVEVLSHYQIPHGQAVTIGILLANEMSFNRGFLPAGEREETKKLAFQLLDERILKMMKNLPVEGMFSLLKKDKKTTGSRVNFIVIHKIGDMRVLPIELNQDLVKEVSATIQEVFR